MTNRSDILKTTIVLVMAFFLLAGLLWAGERAAGGSAKAVFGVA